MLYKELHTIQRNSSASRGVLKWRPAAALMVTAAVLAVSCPLHGRPRRACPLRSFLPARASPLRRLRQPSRGLRTTRPARFGERR